MSTRRKLSDGEQHARITVALVPVALVLAWLSTGRLDLAGAAGLGCLAGLVLSPDLDQQAVTFSEWVWTKIPLVGWLMTGVWITLWLPYSFVSKHRGVSHWPVVGTLTRVLYLALVALPLALWAGWSPTLETALALAYAVLGLMLSDFGHFGRDWFGWEI